MYQKFLFATFGCGVLMLAAAQVHAQPFACATHDRVVARLAAHFGERRTSVALHEGATMIEVFVAPDTGSWTITATPPGQLTCLVAAGQAFGPLPHAWVPPDRAM